MGLCDGDAAAKVHNSEGKICIEIAARSIPCRSNAAVTFICLILIPLLLNISTTRDVYFLHSLSQ